MRHAPKHFNSHNNRGVALLLAIMITTAALAIALGILNIIIGQLTISRDARESHVALYSADVGKECALYYLYHGTPAPRGSYWHPLTPCNNGACAVECVGNNISVASTINRIFPLLPDVYNEHIFSFQLRVNPVTGGPVTSRSPGVCTNVTVRSQKFESGILSDINCGALIGGRSYIRTIIESDGYSSCPVGVPGGVNRTIRAIDRNDQDLCPNDINTL